MKNIIKTVSCVGFLTAAAYFATQMISPPIASVNELTNADSQPKIVDEFVEHTVFATSKDSDLSSSKCQKECLTNLRKVLSLGGNSAITYSELLDLDVVAIAKEVVNDETSLDALYKILLQDGGLSNLEYNHLAVLVGIVGLMEHSVRSDIVTQLLSLDDEASEMAALDIFRVSLDQDVEMLDSIFHFINSTPKKNIKGQFLRTLNNIPSGHIREDQLMSLDQSWDESIDSPEIINHLTTLYVSHGEKNSYLVSKANDHFLTSMQTLASSDKEKLIADLNDVLFNRGVALERAVPFIDKELEEVLENISNDQSEYPPARLEALRLLIHVRSEAEFVAAYKNL